MPVIHHQALALCHFRVCVWAGIYIVAVLSGMSQTLFSWGRIYRSAVLSLALFTLKELFSTWQASQWLFPGNCWMRYMRHCKEAGREKTVDLQQLYMTIHSFVRLRMFMRPIAVGTSQWLHRFGSPGMWGQSSGLKREGDPYVSRSVGLGVEGLLMNFLSLSNGLFGEAGREGTCPTESEQWRKRWRDELPVVSYLHH